jgi:NAD(P)H-hydrate repair Nnr-like enzyme with NAD(P)H-hydrate dehydratase domain
MAVVLRLRKKCSGERGPDEPAGEKANQGAFLVVGDRAELTGATDVAGSRSGARAGRDMAELIVEWAANVGERRRSCLVRVQGERARLRAQVSRGRWASGARALKGRGRAEVVGECADVGASTVGAWARG